MERIFQAAYIVCRDVAGHLTSRFFSAKLNDVKQIMTKDTRAPGDGRWETTSDPPRKCDPIADPASWFCSHGPFSGRD